MNHRAQQSELPLFPPNYDDVEEQEQHLRQHLPSHGIEQFEIDDMFDEDTEREGFLLRAALLTQKYANRFNHRFIDPVSRMIDPIYEGYKYIEMQYERSILRLGNPLVVKRLFYMFFMAVVLFFATKYNSTDGVDGTTGGGFSLGKLYSVDRLTDSIKMFIDTSQMKTHLEYFLSMPHVAGLHGDLTLARYIQSYMHNNGLKVVDFNEVKAFVNYPSRTNTYLRASDGSHEAQLWEGDGNGMHTWAYNPNALNTNDEIEGAMVYVNYGRPEDYNGVDVKDAILLMNYGGGGIPEANKVKVAHDKGARAVVFISAEVDAGKDKGSTIERINVGLTRVSPGDILTPGWTSDGAYVTKQPWFKSDLTPKLPTIPISWRDGVKFLEKLNGGVKFGDFSLGVVGDGAFRVKMRTSNDERPAQHLWNVVGSIEGREQPEKGIIIGALRDSAGGLGAISNTGSVLLMELVRVFTSMQRQFNWSPSRSIYFASFDGTEYNLAGLTEWIKARGDTLQKEGYVYIDLSDAVGGEDLSVKAHPFLHNVIRDSLKRVVAELEEKDNEKGDKKGDNNNKGNNKRGVSLRNAKDMYQVFVGSNKNNDEISNNMLEQKNYIPFINMVNVPAVEIKYTGAKKWKNSCEDSFDNMESANIDRYMLKHKQLAEVLSTLALQLAEAAIIPYNFNDLSALLKKYEHDLERHAAALRPKDGPVLNFEPLVAAIGLLQSLSSRFHEWERGWRQFLTESADIEPSGLSITRWRWNENMIIFNKIFASPKNEPERAGYVNCLFGLPEDAPETGDEYQWNTFPAIREAMMAGDWNKAEHGIIDLANLIAFAARRFIDPRG